MIEERPRNLEATWVRRLRSAGGRETLDVTIVSGPGEALPTLAARLAALLSEHRAEVVRHDILGSLSCRPALLEALASALGRRTWPLHWVEPSGAPPGRVLGMQVLAVKGCSVESVTAGGRPLGRLYDDGHTRHFHLGDLGGLANSAPRSTQAWELLEELESILVQNGFALRDLVRTWFVLRDILRWYGSFSLVRSQFYKHRGLQECMLPASTGIGGRSSEERDIGLSAWAVRPSHPGTTISHPPSPLQCDAQRYGSAFSRAVEIRTTDRRRVLISGTASIDILGRTAHPGDVDAQIELSMAAAGAILVQQGLTYADVVRGTAYTRTAEARTAFERWCARNGVADLPWVVTPSILCRDDLLFEVELDAARTLDPMAEATMRGRSTRPESGP